MAIWNPWRGCHRKSESEDKFVDGTYQSDENLLNNISTLNKHGA